LIYSLGSDNDVSLEEDLLAINPACEIHTFDCTSNEPPAAKAGRLHFHKTCVAKADVVLDKSMAMSGDVKAGTAAMLSMRTIAQQLGDRTPALVKMDVEGWEWEVLNRWQPQDPFLPDMLALEVHVRSHIPQSIWYGRVKTWAEVVGLFDRLWRLGYVVVSKAPNPHPLVPHACEFTLLRLLC
jgi:hypothetical protein